MVYGLSDISDEFKSVIEELQPHEDKVHCVLNKADMLDTESLMRVYGALLWSMGKVFRGAEVRENMTYLVRHK